MAIIYHKKEKYIFIKIKRRAIEFGNKNKI